MIRRAENEVVNEPIYVIDASGPRIYVWGRILSIPEAVHLKRAIAEAIEEAKKG